MGREGGKPFGWRDGMGKDDCLEDTGRDGIRQRVGTSRESGRERSREIGREIGREHSRQHKRESIGDTSGDMVGKRCREWLGTRANVGWKGGNVTKSYKYSSTRYDVAFVPLEGNIVIFNRIVTTTYHTRKCTKGAKYVHKTTYVLFLTFEWRILRASRMQSCPSIQRTINMYEHVLPYGVQGAALRGRHSLPPTLAQEGKIELSCQADRDPWSSIVRANWRLENKCQEARRKQSGRHMHEYTAYVPGILLYVRPMCVCLEYYDHRAFVSILIGWCRWVEKAVQTHT